MRVLYSHHIFLSQQYGGISRYFVEVASRLAAQRLCDVTVLAPVHVNAHLAHAAPAPVLGARFPAGAAYRRLAWAANEAALRTWLRAGRADLLHLTYYPVRPPRRGRQPIVATVYDMIHERLPQYFPASDRTHDHKGAAVRAADHVICISARTRDDLVECFPEVADRCSVIHLGHTLQATPAPGPLPVSRPYVLYVGLRGGYKNFARLALAFSSSSLPRLGFDLVCFGGGAFTTDELTQLRAAGVDTSRLRQVGGGDDALARLYASAEAFAYPSLYEGFGIPPLEAMSLGCPVVCADSGSLPEIVGAAAERFDPMRVDAIQCALERVVTSPSRAAALRVAGQERAARFSWDACAVATAAVYSRVLSRE